MTNVVITPPVVVEDVADANEAFETLINQIEDTAEGESVNAEEEFDRLVSTPEESNTVSENTVGTNIHSEPIGTAPETSEAPSSTDLLSVPENSSVTSSEVASTVSETSLAIPINSMESTLVDVTARFSGANWYNTVKESSVTIVGAGGIGSWTSLIIGRLGVSSFSIFDGDNVESVNLAGQMFGISDVNSPKVNAVYHHVTDFCGYVRLSSYPSNFTASNFCNPITIGALDNMEARKTVFETWAAQYGTEPNALFIDGRLSADELQIFIIPGNCPERRKEYREKWLFSQAEGEHTQCSFKQTTYMATMIASLIGNVVVNFCANLANPDAMFDLPFFINYNAEMMYFKTKEV